MLADLGDKANLNAELLAAEVRQAFEQVRARFTDLYTPEQMHRFVADFIGRMTVHPDGRAVPDNEATPAETGVAIADIAGGGFEPPTSGL